MKSLKARVETWIIKRARANKGNVTFYASDIAFDLKVDILKVMDVLDELKKERKIKKVFTKDWNVIFAKLRTLWARISTVHGYVVRTLDVPNMILMALRTSVGTYVVLIARRFRVPEWLIQEDLKDHTVKAFAGLASEDEVEEMWYTSTE